VLSTYKLFRDGKTPEQIALIKQIKLGTVENYLISVYHDYFLNVFEFPFFDLEQLFNRHFHLGFPLTYSSLELRKLIARVLYEKRLR